MTKVDPGCETAGAVF